jgi:hypothetical protein
MFIFCLSLSLPLSLSLSQQLWFYFSDFFQIALIFLVFYFNLLDLLLQLL